MSVRLYRCVRGGKAIPTQSADFNVQIKVRNGRLLRRIREKFGTNAEMVRQAGVGASQISALLTMRVTPFKANGELTEAAERICTALGCMPEDIWPKHMERIKLERATREIDLTTAQVEAVIGAEHQVMQRMMLERWTEKLSPREQRAIEAARDGATLDELAAEIGGVTRERARQVQIKALRKVRRRAMRDSVESWEDVYEMGG